MVSFRFATAGLFIPTLVELVFSSLRWARLSGDLFFWTLNLILVWELADGVPAYDLESKKKAHDQSWKQ